MCANRSSSSREGDPKGNADISFYPLGFSMPVWPWCPQQPGKMGLLERPLPQANCTSLPKDSRFFLHPGQRVVYPSPQLCPKAVATLS